MLSSFVCKCGPGSIRGRRGSELKVLSAVETKMSGYFASVREMVARPMLFFGWARPWCCATQHAFLNKLELYSDGPKSPMRLYPPGQDHQP